MMRIGKGKTISICVLSSMDLQAIIKTEDITERTLIVSRLSENKGIDSLVRFTLKHSELVCMREDLLSLYRDGVTHLGSSLARF